MISSSQDIAYFSLEIGLEPTIPTYSGGLGILAGDTIKAAADLALPYVGVTLLYRQGYFRQTIDAAGVQHEAAVQWDPSRELREMQPRVVVPIEGRPVTVRAFRTDIVGVTGKKVPVYFLDTDLPENDARDRAITAALYAGDSDHRIKQEAILGIGGRRMIRAIGHDVGCFHMNEGHAFLVTVELLSEQLARADTTNLSQASIAAVRERCVFTTHTPIAAGHDRFGIDRVRHIVGDHPAFNRPDLYGDGDMGHNVGGSGGHFTATDGVLNTTRLAMNLSKFANAVARKHGEVSRRMFPGYRIEAITNGVHAATWTCQHFRDLFDRHLPEWRRANTDLRLAAGLPDHEVWQAHQRAKGEMVEFINRTTRAGFDPEAFTMVFARRATAYKRPAMVLSDLDRLASIAAQHGPVQIVFGGKSHPHDGRGKGIIQHVNERIAQLKAAGRVRAVYVPNYEIDVCKLLVAGCDVWLNNPEPPLEASGTSGMKAALNGVPSLSTMDGWWLEGWVEGVTGWAIGGVGDSVYDQPAEQLFAAHSASLYDQLAGKVLPLFYDDRAAWIRLMKSAIAINGSHFTTERMVRDYALHAYAA